MFGIFGKATQQTESIVLGVPDQPKSLVKNDSHGDFWESLHSDKANNKQNSTKKNNDEPPSPSRVTRGNNDSFYSSSGSSSSWLSFGSSAFYETPSIHIGQYSKSEKASFR